MMTNSLVHTLKKATAAVTLGAMVALAPAAIDLTGFGAGFGGVAYAQDEKPKTKYRSKKAWVMPLSFVKKLEKIQEAMTVTQEADSTNFTVSLGLITALETGGRKPLSEYERGTLNQLKAQIAFEQDNMRSAISALEDTARLNEIPEWMKENAVWSLAQLWLSEGDYRKSLGFVDQWFRVTSKEPTYTHWIFKGQAHYGLDEYDQSIPAILTAMTLAETASVPVKENWHLLLLSMYWEKEQFHKAKDTLVTLVLAHTKPQYWLQLSAVYGELEDEGRRLGALETAYVQGYLEKESHYVGLSQLMLYNEAPIKAAWVLEKAMADGNVEKSSKNYELLGQAYLNSQEWKKAVQPLGEAAESAEDGTIYYRLGIVQLQIADYAGCVKSMDNALRKKLPRSAERDQANLYKGMCYFNNEQVTNAKKAFNVALKSKDKNVQRRARSWLKSSDREATRLASLKEWGFR